MNDLTLLKQLQQGDQNAFERIYLNHWDMLFKLGFKKVHDKSIAQEIVQNIFESLWKNRDKAPIDALEPYLKAALKFQVFKHYRSEAVKEKYFDHLLSEGTVTTTFIENETGQLATIVAGALDQLPHKTQQVFRLSREEQLSNRAISAQLDISEKTVEYHITRSLKTLRAQLKQFFTF